MTYRPLDHRAGGLKLPRAAAQYIAESRYSFAGICNERGKAYDMHIFQCIQFDSKYHDGFPYFLSAYKEYKYGGSDQAWYDALFASEVDKSQSGGFGKMKPFDYVIRVNSPVSIEMMRLLMPFYNYKEHDACRRYTNGIFAGGVLPQDDLLHQAIFADCVFYHGNPYRTIQLRAMIIEVFGEEKWNTWLLTRRDQPLILPVHAAMMIMEGMPTIDLLKVLIPYPTMFGIVEFWTQKCIIGNSDACESDSNSDDDIVGESIYETAMRVDRLDLLQALVTEEVFEAMQSKNGCLADCCIVL